MQIAELYTPLSEALAELDRRQKDETLKAKVEDYFKGYPPLPELIAGPRAVMARAIFSPVLELLYFLDVQKHLPLKPILYEFTKDKFVGINIDKAALANMTFFADDALGHKTVTGSVRVVDFLANEGKSMREVRTIDGESLVDFHHRLLRGYVKDFDIEIGRFSDWFKGSYAFDPKLRYERYLGLFVRNAILFENFTLQKNEDGFTRSVVMPAFERLISVFGVRPLVVPLRPRDAEDEQFWCCYPDGVRALI